jgi:hypothetical protein
MSFNSELIARKKMFDKRLKKFIKDEKTRYKTVHVLVSKGNGRKFIDERPCGLL